MCAAWVSSLESTARTLGTAPSLETAPCASDGYRCRRAADGRRLGSYGAIPASQSRPAARRPSTQRS
jgi:hypothetical protein